MRPAKLLRKRSRDVVDLTEIGKLVIDMTDTVVTRGLAGLAAVQVGEPLRVIVVSLIGGRTRTLVNPTIVERGGIVLAREGCPSIPGQWHRVERSRTVKVQHLTPSGLEVMAVQDVEFAVAIQHECDHLNGVLTLDRAIRATNAFAVQ